MAMLDVRMISLDFLGFSKVVTSQILWESNRAANQVSIKEIYCIQKGMTLGFLGEASIFGETS